MKPRNVRVVDNDTVASSALKQRLPLADASQAAQAQHWLPLGCRQISTGHFNGLIESIELAGVELIHERHDQAVYKTGCTPDNQCTISLVERSDCAARFSQFSPDANASLFFLPQQTEFDVIVPAGCATSYVHLDQAELLEAMAKLNAPLAEQLAAQGDLQSLGIHGKRALENSFHALRPLASELESQPTAAPSVAALRRNLFEHLLVAIAATARPVPGTAPNLHARRRALHLVRSAREYVDAALEQRQTPTVAEMCIATSVSERSLQYAFRAQLGTTPSGYLRIARLNGARAELIRSTKAETSLTAIATRWGFLHIGRFTHDYRQLFHESPKAALSYPFDADRG
jgi:AraC family ethanolamine operon transcriptional activator